MKNEPGLTPPATAALAALFFLLSPYRISAQPAAEADSLDKREVAAAEEGPGVDPAREQPPEASDPSAAGLDTRELERELVPSRDCFLEARDFADHLLEQGDAYRAIGEYKRYLFLAPAAADSDLVSYRIALSYALGEQHETALSLFERLSADPTARPEIRHAAWAAAGKAFLDLDRHGPGAGLLSEPPGSLRDPYVLGWAAYARGHGHLRRFDLSRAAEAFEQVPSSTPWAEPATALAAELRRPPRLPTKSPVLAGLLSLVPGLGHMYLGMWGTAFSALTWNGAFIWAMYETGSAGQWGVFTLLAVVESLWYTGSIYGAVAGAYRHNRDARLNYLDDLDGRFPSPGRPPQPLTEDAPPLDLEGAGIH